MSITTLFNNPRVLFQTADDESMEIPEPAIAASTDATGLIVLEQEGRGILVNRASVPELVKLLRELAKAGAQAHE